MAHGSSDQVMLLYRCDSEAPLPKENVLDEYLNQRRYSVLFVGEGNFTFTMALAAYRIECDWLQCDVWDGIKSTCYKDVLLPDDGTVKEECKEQINVVFDKNEVIRDSKKRMIDCVPDHPPSYWRANVDATSLPQSLVLEAEMIWFQCPWNSKEKVSCLIQDFLRDVGSKMRPHTLVCIGITKHKSYFKHYKLNEILGPYFEAKDGSTECLQLFKFVGVDDDLIQHMLGFGYKHMTADGKSGLHNQISNLHLTLIFEKKDIQQFLGGPIWNSRNSILDDILIKQRRPVLFVGEGNFTFTVAFAALRNMRSPSHSPWDGITTSRHELVGPKGCHLFVGCYERPCLPAPVMAEVKQLCLNSVRRQTHESGSVKLKIYRTIQALSNFEYSVGVDVCNIPSKLIPPDGVIWFQCPSGDQPDTLIESFLVNNSANIKPNTYVCIGIANDAIICGIYELERILGSDLRDMDGSTPYLHNYRFIGADTDLIDQIYECGYFHSNPKCNKIPHVALVFQRILHDMNYLPAQLKNIHI